MSGQKPVKNDTPGASYSRLLLGGNHDRPRLNHSRRAGKTTTGVMAPSDKESLARINGREDIAAWQPYWLSAQVRRSGAQQVSEELSVSVYGKE